MKAVLRWILGLYVALVAVEDVFLPTPGILFGAAIAIVLLYTVALVHGHVRIRYTSAGAMMVLLGTLALVSSFWSADPEWTFHYSVMMFELMIITWILASTIDDVSSLQMMVWFLVLASVYPAQAIVRDYLSGALEQQAAVAELRQIGDRLSFGNADPNLDAFRTVISTLAAIHLFLTTRAMAVRLLLAALVCLFVGAALLTGSRGGGLAMAGSTAVLLLAEFRYRKGPALLFLVGLPVLLLVAFPRLPPSLAARFLGIRQEIATGTMAERKLIYKEAEASVGRHPGLGVGYLAFQIASGKEGGLGLAAHNDPLEVTTGLGVVGLAVYVLMVAALFFAAGSVPHPAKGLAFGMLTAYLISGFSITLLATKIAWFCFGVVLGAAGLAKPGASSGNWHLGHWAPMGESRHD